MYYFHIFLSITRIKRIPSCQAIPGAGNHLHNFNLNSFANPLSSLLWEYWNYTYTSPFIFSLALSLFLWLSLSLSLTLTSSVCFSLILFLSAWALLYIFFLNFSIPLIFQALLESNKKVVLFLSLFQNIYILKWGFTYYRLGSARNPEL